MGGGRRVTLNEVLRLSRRAFLTLGVGPGGEWEPAQAVTWLEARGLPGLAMLVADLERFRGGTGQAPRIAAEDQLGPGELRLDADAGPTLWAVCGAVDWLLSRPAGAYVRIDNACSALWALPLMAARCAERVFWLEASGADAAPQLAARCVAANGIVVESGASPRALVGAATDVVMGTGVPPRPLQLRNPVLMLDAATLDSRYRDSLRHGVHVEEAIWSCLAAVGRESLVPASEASRMRGAGGGDDSA